MPEEDDELWKRFQALKAPKDLPSVPKPQNPVDQRAKAAVNEDDELERIADGRWVPPIPPGSSRTGKSQGDQDDLRKRIATLKGQEVDFDPEEVELGDDEVEAYIASLEGTTLSPPDKAQEDAEALPRQTEHPNDLEREIAAALRDTEGFVKHPTPPNLDPLIDTAIKADPGYPKNDRAEADWDGETEEEILAKALEEASLQNLHTPKSTPPTATQPDATGSTLTKLDELNFPSLPTHNPESNDREDDADPDTKARMNLLLGLSGPSHIPASKSDMAKKGKDQRQAGQGWNLPGYQDIRDDDLESWCCICNSDATLKCHGCDGDLYCQICWREGHGPGGEQGHRVTKFVWGRKRAMGA